MGEFLNKNIGSYKDRLSNLENNEVFSKNLSRKDINRMSDYLLNSKDLERDNYYISESNMFQNSPEYKSYKSLHNANLKYTNLVMSRKAIEGLVSTDSVVDVHAKDMFEEDDYNVINFLFKNSNMDKKTLKAILNHAHEVLSNQDKYSQELVLQVDYIFNEAINACKENEKDLEILKLFSKNFSVTQIAIITGVSKQAISKRITRILSKMF